MRSFPRSHNPAALAALVHAARSLAGEAAALGGCLMAYMGGLALLAMAMLAVIHALDLAPVAPEIRAIAEMAVPADPLAGPPALPLRGSL